MKAEALAFISFVHHEIETARLYELYLIQENYDDFTNALYKSPDYNVPFPLSSVQSYFRKRNFLTILKPEETEERVLRRAKVAIEGLSVRFGEGKKYFYGNSPGVLDAIVFGYLATILYMPLPNSKLRPIIAQYKNLVRFCEGVQKEWFGKEEDEWFLLDKEELERERREWSEKRAKVEEEVGGEGSKKESKEEEEKRKYNRYFLYGCAAVFGAFVLLGGDVALEAPSLEQ